MILITGANGNLGSMTIDFLLKKDPTVELAGLVRNEEKGEELKEKGVEIRVGDYNNFESLHKAMEGVKRLLLISSSSLDNRTNQHKNVILAAKDAGVDQIFYTSILQADKLLSPLSEDHYETEKIIQESDIPYTFFRNTFYTEFLPIFLGNAMETGEWVFPSEGNRINLALREEMAEALANGLLNSRSHLNKVYEITAKKSYSLQEIAKILEEEIDTKVSYKDITIEEFTNQLEQAGLPQDAIMMSAAVATTFVNGGLDYTFGDLEQLLEREPLDVQAYIKKFMKSN